MCVFMYIRVCASLFDGSSTDGVRTTSHVAKLCSAPPLENLCAKFAERWWW